MDNSSRWTDKLWNLALVTIGALSAILWGIIWGNVSNLQGRTSALEGDKRVMEAKLDLISADLKEIKQDLKERRNQ